MSREIRRVYDRAVKMPSKLVEEIARTVSQAQNIWAEARRNNDFATFAPWLDKIVALKREEAKAVGYKESPYDALLDEYEPGATAAEITRVFAELRAELVPLVAAIASSGKKPRTGHPDARVSRGSRSTSSARQPRRRSASIFKPAGSIPPCTHSAAASAPAIAD